MKLKWQRQDGAWHLWRWVVDMDLGEMFWLETGFVVHRTRHGAWIDWPKKEKFTTGCINVADAKAEAERLAKLA
jgi:hypothetical protein